MAATADGRSAAQAAGPEAGSPEELVQRVQALTAELEAASDPAAQARAEELVGAVIEMYGAGLTRVFATLDEAG